MELILDFPKVKAIVESYTEKVDSLIDSYADRKEELISLLKDVQAEFNYIPRDVLIKVSQKLDIPLSQVFSVATFFRAFHPEAQRASVAREARGAMQLALPYGRRALHVELPPGCTVETLDPPPRPALKDPAAALASALDRRESLRRQGSLPGGGRRIGRPRARGRLAVAAAFEGLPPPHPQQPLDPAVRQQPGYCRFTGILKITNESLLSFSRS